MKRNMASILSKLVLLALLLAFSTSLVRAQEKKKPSLGSQITNASQNKIVFHAILSHYIRDKSDELYISDIKHYLINPGCEALYQFGNKKLTYLTGLSYQYGQLSSIKDGNYRFSFSEVSIPFILQCEKKLIDKNGIFFSSGIYLGRFLHLKWLNGLSSGWEEKDYKNLTHYSKNNWLFTDIFLDTGYNYYTYNDNLLSFSVFFRYRIKDNWFGYYKAAPYFGIKIGYQLTFNKQNL